jgi:hypothetical protein
MAARSGGTPRRRNGNAGHGRALARATTERARNQTTTHRATGTTSTRAALLGQARSSVKGIWRRRRLAALHALRQLGFDYAA